MGGAEGDDRCQGEGKIGCGKSPSPVTFCRSTACAPARGGEPTAPCHFQPEPGPRRAESRPPDAEFYPSESPSSELGNRRPELGISRPPLGARGCQLGLRRCPTGAIQGSTRLSEATPRHSVAPSRDAKCDGWNADVCARVVKRRAPGCSPAGKGRSSGGVSLRIDSATFQAGSTCRFGRTAVGAQRRAMRRSPGASQFQAPGSSRWRLAR